MLLAISILITVLLLYLTGHRRNHQNPDSDELQDETPLETLERFFNWRDPDGGDSLQGFIIIVEILLYIGLWSNFGDKVPTIHIFDIGFK